jgi:hypothetical protein
MRLVSNPGEIIQIDTDPIGVGVERVCYVHPYDSNNIIKISRKKTLQTTREIKYYTKLIKRKNVSFDHLPNFYGTVKTNLGDGFVVELIRDYDGEISKSLNWQLKNGLPLTALPDYLDELKNYFLNNLIIFNYDMRANNLLFQKTSENNARLVLIDGLGDVVYIKWLNMFPSHVRKKIHRRFERFTRKLYSAFS